MIAANKTWSNCTIKTLNITDGKATTNLEETMRMMAEQLITRNDDTDGTYCRKQIRAQAKEQIQTFKGRVYTNEKVKNAIEELKRKKSQGEIVIAADMYQRVYK